MATVNTVRGPVETSELGPTLMHEHVVNINAEVAQAQPALSWGEDPDQVIDTVVSKLQEIVDRGIRTIVDATVVGHGRDVAAVQRINERVDLNIVVSTGIYTYDDLPFFFIHRKPASNRDRDVMTELFVRDITQGIAGTGVKAAIIKCVTDKAGVTANVERVLRAVAVAHRETGAPITTHSVCEDRNGLDQQRVFREEGVDLTRVVIGHSGDSQDLDYLRELMDAGSTIGSDRFGLYMPGFPTMDQRVDTVAQLCALGYAGQIVLSHDFTLHSDWSPPGAIVPLPPQWRQTHISDDVIPALLKRGVTPEQVDQMMVTNPARIFSRKGSY
jgi:phosphotriesterase-related protein